MAEGNGYNVRSKSFCDRGVVWNDRDKEILTNLFVTFRQKIPNLYLSNYPLSNYQKFLLKTIYTLREQGYSYIRVSQYLNYSELKSTRGKRFTPSMISQIIKKNEIRLKRREIKYKIILYDFRLELNE